MKRYSHIKRVSRFRAKACGTSLLQTERICTRESGHRGLHVAHGHLSGVLAVWDETPSAVKHQPETARRAGAERANTKDSRRSQRHLLGLKNKDSTSLSRRILRSLWHLLKSPDEVGMVFLFLVFVYWGIRWMMMILQ